MRQNDPSPARYRAASACRAASANSTANEDLLAAVPGRRPAGVVSPSRPAVARGEGRD
jgi:hypothetical protein